ncbi:glycosyltransferase family 2 protein [Candidatus Woesearchaeota archaeon]|nr:glycosyltransferase family 2 protein [Candidatus Woesearchaeota archaeon]
MAITLGELLLYSTSYFGLFTATLFFLMFFEKKQKLQNPLPNDIGKVTIAVPAYNEEKTIKKTLLSLLRLDYPKNKLEIIVVDDGSTDKTYLIAKQMEKDVRAARTGIAFKVITKENTGKGDSLNAALAHATGSFFGALDADSMVEPDALQKIIGYFNDARVMAVTPSLKIYQPKGMLQRIQSIEYLLGIYLRKVFAYFDAIHVTPGPFTIYRKQFFDKYGGYDAGNITEDIEIALRIQSNQYRIENAIDAVVWTIGPATMAALNTQRRRWYLGFLNNVITYRRLFSKKHHDLGLFILPGAFISVGLAVLLLLYLAIKMIQDAGDFIRNLVAINFDILPWLKLKIDLFFFNMNPLFFLAIIGLATGIVIIHLAKKYSREAGTIKTAYLMYLVVYWAIFAYWWLIAGYCKACGKQVRWGKQIR